MYRAATAITYFYATADMRGEITICYVIGSRLHSVHGYST